MIASTSFLASSVTMSGGEVAVATRASLWMSKPEPLSGSAPVSRKGDRPTTAAIFPPLRSSALARPAELEVGESDLPLVLGAKPRRRREERRRAGGARGEELATSERHRAPSTP